MMHANRRGVAVVRNTEMNDRWSAGNLDGHADLPEFGRMLLVCGDTAVRAFRSAKGLRWSKLPEHQLSGSALNSRKPEPATYALPGGRASGLKAVPSALFVFSQGLAWRGPGT